MARGGRISGEVSRFAARQVGRFLPNTGLLRAIANATDDVQRAPTTFLDFIAEGLPVARQQLPAREDELEQPVRRPRGQRGLGAFSPIQASQARDGVTGLDRDIQAAKREALRALVDDPPLRARRHA